MADAFDMDEADVVKLYHAIADKDDDPKRNFEDLMMEVLQHRKHDEIFKKHFPKAYAGLVESDDDEHQEDPFCYDVICDCGNPARVTKNFFICRNEICNFAYSFSIVY